MVRLADNACRSQNLVAAAQQLAYFLTCSITVRHSRPSNHCRTAYLLCSISILPEYLTSDYLDSVAEALYPIIRYTLLRYWTKRLTPTSNDDSKVNAPPSINQMTQEEDLIS
jgi:hypothetical protein